MRALLLREDFADYPPTATGRTLHVRLATYGRAYTIRGPRGTIIARERIMPGAFRGPIARPRGGLLRYRHAGELPGDIDVPDYIYGACTALRDEAGAIVGDYEVFADPAGDKLLRLVESGAIRGASLSGVVLEDRPGRDPAGPLTEILRFAPAVGVSLTPTPAYDDAAVLAIRDMTRRAIDPARLAAERAYWAAAR